MVKKSLKRSFKYIVTFRKKRDIIKIVISKYGGNI